MISPLQRHDKLVRATDLDALSCRFNANQRGYFIPQDKYIPEMIRSYQKHLPFCQGYTNLLVNRTLRAAFQEPKLPLINRGTYFRTKSIDIVLDDFISQHGKKCQIISLGSGSDTRAFRTLEKYPDSGVIYHEIDFPESTKIKRAAIVNNSEIMKLIKSGDPIEESAVSSRKEFESLESDFHSSVYHLYGLDLRKLTSSSIEFPHVDTTLPTIIISECVLCYLTPEENVQVLSYWTDLFTSSSPTATMAFLIYEPMSLNDSFGKTMVTNLSGRGITLPTFEKFPDLDSRKQFFTGFGFNNTNVTDLSVIGGYEKEGQSWVTKEEFNRISSLELVDEVEEIKLLLRHYCLIFTGIGQNIRNVDLFKKEG